MSKKAAIQLALAMQMAIDVKPQIGLRGALTAPPLPVPDAIPDAATDVEVRAHAQALRISLAGLRAGYGGAGYEPSAVRNLLAQVSFILRADQPPYKFDWWKLDPAAAGECALFALIDMVAAETTGVDEKADDEK